MNFKTASGRISKTMVVGWLQVGIAFLVALAEFLQHGDFSAPAIVLFASGVLTIILRSVTSEPLS